PRRKAQTRLEEPLSQLTQFSVRLTPSPTRRRLKVTFSRQGKWGSAVQFGRGPATVIGCNAESQATLPRRRGWAYFAREYASSTRPASRRVFLLSNCSQPSRQGRFVHHIRSNS